MKGNNSGAGGGRAYPAYNNINEPYNPYEKDFGEENQSRAVMPVQPTAPSLSLPLASRRKGDLELHSFEDDLFTGKVMNSSGAGAGVNMVGEGNGLPTNPQIIYRDATESERDYFRKLINVGILQNLIKVQLVASIVIFFSQMVLYAISEYYYRQLLLVSGIGFWAPILFFAPTCWLTYLTTKSPSGCVIGSALAFQILSVVLGFVLIIMSLINMTQLGRYTTTWYNNGNGRNSSYEKYDPEATARVFTAFFIIGAANMTVTSLIACIQYCRITCCGRANANVKIHQAL